MTARLGWAALLLSLAPSLVACGEVSLRATAPVATVTGAICDQAHNKFVPNARVRLIERDRDGKLVQEHSTVTNDEGIFTVTSVRNGSHLVQADKDGFSTEFTVTVQRDQNVEIPIPNCELPVGTITGRACDEQHGAWFEGASVSVQGPKGLVSASQATDVLGAFTIANVPSGDREVVATKNGHEVKYKVHVPADGTVDIGVSDCVLNGLSNIEGQICANAVGLWLPGARVSLTDTPDSYATDTDINGAFVMRAVPAGAHHVKVEKGAFVVEFDVTTELNKTKKLDAPVCTPPDIAVAAVSGNFDQAQKVLSRLKFSNVTLFKGYDEHDDIRDMPADVDGNWVEHLLDGAHPGIEQYRIVVFNSGLDLTLLGPAGSGARNTRLLALRNYVQQGGFIYVSDWAFELIAAGFGSPLDFHGADNIADSARVGTAGQIDGAQVGNAQLQAMIGSNTVDLNITLANWVVVDKVLTDATVYMAADVTVAGDLTVHDAPLLASFPLGSGKVVFTSLFKHFASDDIVNKVMTFLIFEL